MVSSVPAFPAPPDNDYRGFVLGRVLLDRPLAEASVKIFTTDGALLHQTTTDKLGWWHVRATVPPDFTVRAYDGQDVYATEIRGGWHRGTLYVNAATTLASAYLRTHPGFSLPEVEAKVHDFLRLPTDYKLSWVSSVKARYFIPAQFFAQVRQAGSLEAYLQVLLAQMDASPVQLKSLLSYALSLGQSAASALYQSTVNDAAGSAVSHMGFNFTTAGALANIQAQLSDVQSDLQQLTDTVNTAIATAALNTTLQTMDPAVASNNQTTFNINQQVGQMLSASSQPGSQPFNVPVPASTPLESLAATLRSDLVQNNNSAITRGLVPPGNLTSSAVRLLAAAQMAAYNLDDASSYGNYPWRGNYLTSQQQAFTARYCNALAQGANLLCEDAHVQLPTDQAGAINEAANATQAVFGTIQTASQLVPDQMPSDEVLFDMSSSLIWYGAFMAPDTWQDAQDTARNFEIGPYYAGGWALPNINQLQNLLLLPRVLKQNGSFTVNGGQWPDYPTSTFTAAFSKLGFNTTNYAAYSENNHPNRSNDEGAWLVGTDQSASDYLNLYFWNNTGNNPSTQPEDEGEAKDTISFLLYYQYPGEIVMSSRPAEQLLVPLNGALGDLPESFDQVLSPWASGYMNAAPVVSVRAQNGLGTQMQVTQTFSAGGPYLGTQDFGNINYAYDATARASWTSSNPTVATISNIVPTASPGSSPLGYPVAIPPSGTDLPTAPPGPVGFVTWHPPLSGSPLPAVTVTASLVGFTDGNGTTGTLSTSYTLTPPAGLKPQLKQVQALPLNLIYNVSTSGPTKVLMGLCAYYADGQCEDVSTNTNTTWQAFDANGNLLNSGSVGGFGPNVTTGPKNELNLTANITTTNVSVVGTYTSPWGTASSNVTFGLSKPVVSPTPTPSPSPTPSASPTLLALSLAPASATYNSLPATLVFNALGILSNGQTQPFTQSAVWQLQLPGGGGQLPASQGTVQVTSGGAVVTLNPTFTGSSVVVVAVAGGFVGEAVITPVPPSKRNRIQHSR